MVIAIIGILASILLPVIKNITEVANASKCKMLFKNQGTAFIAYANENDGWIATTLYADANSTRQAMLEYLNKGSTAGKNDDGLHLPDRCQEERIPTPRWLGLDVDQQHFFLRGLARDAKYRQRCGVPGRQPLPIRYGNSGSARSRRPALTLAAADSSQDTPIDAVGTGGVGTGTVHATMAAYWRQGQLADGDGSVREMASGEGEGQTNTSIWVTMLP